MAHHTAATGEEERDIEPIKCMRSPHTSYRWRGESHRANQVMCSPHTSYRWRERDIEPINVCAHTHQLQVERRERHRANQVYALTTHQLQVERRESHRANQVYALHTPATGGEERVIEPIKCMRSPQHHYSGEERES